MLGYPQNRSRGRGGVQRLTASLLHTRGRPAAFLDTATKVANMRAAYYTKQGAAQDMLHVGEQPTPEPGPGEVRVRLRTSGVNRSDWQVRRGRFGGGLVAPLIIPHSDGAGDIDAVGPDVSNRLGERVWIWNGQWKRPHGTAAEYIVLPSAQAVQLPPNVSYAEGACLGIPALTAVQAMRLAKVGPAPKC
jgi:NADPH:quinone reductase